MCDISNSMSNAKLQFGTDAKADLVGASPWRLPAGVGRWSMGAGISGRFDLVRSVMATAAIVIALAGCSSSVHQARTTITGAPASHGFPVSVRDDLGHSITLAAPPRRIVSLIPSVTETLFAIGCGPQVVADTVYDDYPGAAVKLPKIGSGTRPSAESILAFHPDLVVATDGNPPELLNELVHLHVPVFAVHPRTVMQVEECIRRLGLLTGHSEQANHVAARMEVRVDRIEKAVASDSSHPVTGLIEVGYNPLFVAGPSSFVSDVFRLAGGRNVAPAGGDYEELSAEGVLALRPQTIFLAAEVNPSISSVRNRPGWSQVAAVRSGRVYSEEASLLDRRGPRVVLGLQDLAMKLYPQAFAVPESNSRRGAH